MSKPGTPTEMGVEVESKLKPISEETKQRLIEYAKQKQNLLSFLESIKRSLFIPPDRLLDETSKIAKELTDRVIAFWKKLGFEEPSEEEKKKIYQGYIDEVESIRKRLPEITKPKYPIVKIDRATSQVILPILMNRGIFSNYISLKTREEILENEKSRLQKEDLSYKEKRIALTRAREYKDNNYVFRDYGNYAIGFSAKLYIDYLQNIEDKLKQELSTPELFEEIKNKRIAEALKGIKLYRIAHELAFIILSEGYIQKTFKGLVISKKRIIELLKYSPEEKQIYRDVREALTPLRWLDYILFDYTFSNTAKITDTAPLTSKEEKKMVGNFIYNLGEDSKNFYFDINERFVGCVQYLITEDKLSKQERKELFKRGYYHYITRALSLTRDYTTPAYLLTHFLIRERGNKHFKERGYKVIAYKVERYINEARIQVRQPSKKYKIFISALKEIEIIEKTEPTIEELENLKPSEGIKTMLYVWIPHPVKKLDKQIELKLDKKSNLLVLK